MVSGFQATKGAEVWRFFQVAWFRLLIPIFSGFQSPVKAHLAGAQTMALEVLLFS
jgi:hypothetical protein